MSFHLLKRPHISLHSHWNIVGFSIFSLAALVDNQFLYQENAFKHQLDINFKLDLKHFHRCNYSSLYKVTFSGPSTAGEELCHIHLL